MQRHLTSLIGVACLAVAFSSSALTQAATPEEAAHGVLRRLLPDAADQFVLESIPADEDRDVFEIESRDGKIVVRGSSGVAISSGVNWYLKYHCNCHVSFCGDQLRLPDPLPAVEEKVRRASPFRYRYCFNYCAFSYTLAFWDWAQWERMIDWMALHGINMPLSVTGQEAVWYQVGRDLGLSDEEIRQFLVGPGYLPFGWMGCIDGWGGPLPHTWIESHRKLQKKIVARQRELGMTPVLQGFTGHVPVAMKEHFPEAKFQQLPSWCQFPGTTFLDPMDPMFEQVGKAFVEEQTRQFGTDHLYASDTFIEMSPPSDDPAFLEAMGEAVYGAMKAGDPEAKWVMQGWVFFNNPRFWKPPQSKALLRAVPDDRMILLDLFCETRPVWPTTEAFYGKPWVFSIIQNFGGRVGLYGGLRQIAENLATALESPKRGKLSGVGLIMEGFGYNPIIYDFLTEMTWHSEVPGLEPWVGDFVRSRYGAANPKAEEAWKRLTKTAYSTPGYVGTVICRRPGLNVPAPSSPYPEQLNDAWEELLDAADELGDADTYQFDLVHLAREVVGDAAGILYGDLIDAYQRKDREALAAAGERFLQSIRDVDRLLATRREFLLGKWIADAKRWATNDAERRQYEWNARNLITLWGPRDSILHEYAQRQWSGLIGGFYLPRWELFVQRLDETLAAGKPLDAAAFEQEIRDWEVSWTHGTELYPAKPHGDPVALARELKAKYGRIVATEPEVKSLTTGKPTTCSFALGPYPAHLANDGRLRNTNRFWATDVNVDKEAWWQVDLEEPITIGRVVIVFFYGDERTYGFTVETSLDGTKWERVGDYRENHQPATRQGTTCTFPPKPVRYLRVTFTHNSANTGRHLVEVLAFEK